MVKVFCFRYLVGMLRGHLVHDTNCPTMSSILNTSVVRFWEKSWQIFIGPNRPALYLGTFRSSPIFFKAWNYQSVRLRNAISDVRCFCSGYVQQTKLHWEERACVRSAPQGTSSPGRFLWDLFCALPILRHLRAQIYNQQVRSSWWCSIEKHLKTKQNHCELLVNLRLCMRMLHY